ncbi:MAG TPA: ABC transporter permease subunit [Terriglobia bacterium]|nr:ABC transporter permease subunit [Terriglobia bacterium]
MRPGIFLDTFQESFRNKMFLFFFVVATLIIGSIGLALNMDAVNGVMRGVTFFGTALRVPAFTVKQWVESLQAGLAMLIGTFGLFMALMATSTLFPTLLQKGSVDLLLCRPIPRWRIITSRFLGGVSIMAFNAVFLFVGVWAVLGLKADVWNNRFPMSSALVIFAFIVLFSVVMIASVVTENGPAGLLAAATLLIFSPILAAHEQITPAFSTELYREVFRSLYWVLPKSAETISAMRRLILNRPLDINWVVGTSVFFALACYVVTMIYFTRKDY